MCQTPSFKFIPLLPQFFLSIPILHLCKLAGSDEGQQQCFLIFVQEFAVGLACDPAFVFDGV